MDILFGRKIKEKIILFADPGIDDSVAIMYALLNPGIKVLAIVSSYGNVTKEQATDNITYLLQLAGRSDIPIMADLIVHHQGKSQGSILIFMEKRDWVRYALRWMCRES